MSGCGGSRPEWEKYLSSHIFVGSKLSAVIQEAGKKDKKKTDRTFTFLQGKNNLPPNDECTTFYESIKTEMLTLI